MKRMLTAALALSLLGGSAVLAQQNNQGHNDSVGKDNPHWSRGDRVPSQYRQKQYVVTDWKGSRLRKPPHGYHWVRNDNNDYFLAAVTTGVIADIVLNTR